MKRSLTSKQQRKISAAVETMRGSQRGSGAGDSLTQKSYVNTSAEVVKGIMVNKMTTRQTTAKDLLKPFFDEKTETARHSRTLETRQSKDSHAD